MRRPSGTAEALWQLQDLRERLILAEAEQVKAERRIREVVRHLPNRAGRFGGGRVPLYTNPANAVNALRELGGLPWLARPGLRNRVKPQVLLERWERAANETAILRSQVGRMEDGLIAAGIVVSRKAVR
jgi:hypothetical protein